MIIIFVIILILLLFTYFGYPLCLVIISSFSKKSKTELTYSPKVSLIIPVYNEEKIIEEKIKNSLSLVYPKDKLEIIVASDGSTDNTKMIVKKYITDGVKFFDFPRGGKLATLNRVLHHTSGEILVFTDANAMFIEDALHKLIRHFADESIGVVTGVERMQRETHSIIDLSESAYWNYETKLKEWEGKIYSTVGANGPIYAIRRELFPVIPSHLNLCDDMAISLSAVQKNKRIILEPEAIAFEKASLTLQEEWRRKKRIATRAWQALFYHKNLLIPFKSPIALPLLFHKVLRWLTLLLLIILLITNFFVKGVFYNVFLILQIGFYILSSISFILLWYNIRLPIIFSFFGYFLLTNLAQLIGLYNAVFKKGSPMWQPIQRA
ncbi:MAG: glycosyltransferase family 2 protein [bacterium]